MIITQCPYRVSFLEEEQIFLNGTRKKGCNIISASINAYCYITIRKLLPFYGANYRVSWSQIEEVNNIEKIQHPAIRGALKFLNIKSGLEIHTDGDLPARSGLGSSSAFSSALLLSLKTFKGEDITLKQLTEETIHFEQQILKENVGIQDQIQTCNGGFNLLSINKKGDYRILRLDIGSDLVRNISRKMMLVYSGITRNSSDIQASNHKLDDQKRFKSLEKIAQVADDITKKIMSENLSFNEFSSALEETWMHKVNLFPKSKVTENLLKIYEDAKKSGAYSGKLLGAGGGGFFLFLVEEDLQEAFIRNMSQYTVIKHEISNNSCKLLFNAFSKKSQ